MPEPAHRHVKQATLAGLGEQEGAPEASGNPPQPAARFFGVPFLKGTREVTAIHLCPAMLHLATIHNGSELEVAHRLTYQALALGDLATARLIAFRPRALGDEAIELAIVGPPGKAAIARFELKGSRVLAGLPLTEVTAITYRFDGRFVAAGNRGGRVRVWHLGTDVPALVLEDGLEAPVEGLTFHPEHPTLYAILATGALRELALAPSLAAPVEAILRERASGVRFLRVCAGRFGYPIYLAGRDERVYVVDTATGEVGSFAPEVGPIQDLQILPASGHLCVVGRHSVYLAHAVGADPHDHLALVCGFAEPIYAAWELAPDAVLVFHAGEAALRADPGP